MSIFGVKKKLVDTSEIAKEILNMKSELLTMDTKDKYLYKSDNAINLRVLNIENIVSNIRNRPDRKIISIYAGIDGPISIDQKFSFSDGGGSFLLTYPGQILSISLVSIRSNSDNVFVNTTLNGKDIYSGISLSSKSHGYFSLNTPFKVEAGDLIGFTSTVDNPGCFNTLVSVIIEIFL